MSALETLELVGTLCFLLFAGALAWIAVHLERFTRYGQEALLAASAFLFTAGLMRLLVIVDWLSREQAVTVNSAAAVSFVLIGAQLVALREVSIHHKRREH